MWPSERGASGSRGTHLCLPICLHCAPFYLSLDWKKEEACTWRRGECWAKTLESREIRGSTWKGGSIWYATPGIWRSVSPGAAFLCMFGSSGSNMYVLCMFGSRELSWFSISVSCLIPSYTTFSYSPILSPTTPQHAATPTECTLLFHQTCSNATLAVH